MKEGVIVAVVEEAVYIVVIVENAAIAKLAEEEIILDDARKIDRKAADNATTKDMNAEIVVVVIVEGIAENHQGTYIVIL